MARLAAVVGLLILGAASSTQTIRGMRHPALSPDGLRIAFDWHGDIWVGPVDGGIAERVTDDPADEQKPCWSPDGTRLAFSSDKSGNRDLFVVEVGDTRTLDQAINRLRNIDAVFDAFRVTPGTH